MFLLEEAGLLLLLLSTVSSALIVAALSYSASFFSGSVLPAVDPWSGAEGGLMTACSCFSSC